MVSSAEFAEAIGVCERVARRHLAKGSYLGEPLPAIQLPARRGGKRGTAWALRLEGCSDSLRAKIEAQLDLSSTEIEGPVKSPFKALPKDRHYIIAQDKARIIAPILATAKGSAERTEAFRQVAGAAFHVIGGVKRPVAENTLRDWVRQREQNPTDLVPNSRSDAGEARVLISRAWDKGCGLPDHLKAVIAQQLERTARGLIGLGRSGLQTRKLCAQELMKATVEAGAKLPKAQLRALCKISQRWVDRFRDMKAVHLVNRDHKAHSDRHEYHVRLGLTRRPMEVLMGDVHHISLTISDAISSPDEQVRLAGYRAIAAGKQKVKALIIAWMDGSSGYIWATPVICGPGQSVTTQDVARSLWAVLSCPFGGMPREFRIDNGSEFKAMDECVQRFIVMADMAGLGVVTCRPYHPEGKARLEGAFGIIQKSFFSALPGFNGGDPMNPRMAGRGKPVPAYERGVDRLVADIQLSVQQYNGTAQGEASQLKGLSPKGMLERKIEETGWSAQRIEDPDMFDLVFSREALRDVRQGSVTIGGKQYSGKILAELIGHKQVSFLVPLRDPEGSILFTRVEGEGDARRLVVHRLHSETFDLADPAGAIHRGEMVALQKAELDRRKAKGDFTLDVQQMLSDAADLSPVKHNPPDNWTFSAIDKGNFLGAPISETEARQRQADADRDDIEEFLAFDRAGKREASGCNR